MTRRLARPRACVRALVALLCVGTLSLAACSTERPAAEAGGTAPASGTPSPQLPTGAPAERTKLSYGVFGTDEEVAAYQAVVDAYNRQATTVEVTLRSWPTSAAMLQAVAAGADLPDIYQVARSQLAGVIGAERNVPLFSLLEDRNVSYGDDYPLDTIEAFSLGNDLQCMPYGISPQVMYVNTDLVDFDRMRLRGPARPGRAAARLEHRGVRGRHRVRHPAAPAHAGLQCSHRRWRASRRTCYSGGGMLFDDDIAPRPSSSSSDENQQSLATLLALARDPLITLTDDPAAPADAAGVVQAGALGHARRRPLDLTPDLRDVPDLDFDVMPMPRLGRTVTTGDVTGMCIAPGRNVQRAADFLVHLISAEGFAPVARAGYVVPANTSVGALGGLPPARARAGQRGGLQRRHRRHRAVAPGGQRPGAQGGRATTARRALHLDPPLDLEAATAYIDAVARPIIDPTYVPESPSEVPTGLPSASPTGSPPRRPESTGSGGLVGLRVRLGLALGLEDRGRDQRGGQRDLPAAGRRGRRAGRRPRRGGRRRRGLRAGSRAPGAGCRA